MEVKSARKRHPLDLIGVLLAIIIMILPLEADMMYPLLSHKMYVQAVVLYMACLLVVGIPFALARIKCRREPDKWQTLNWSSIIVGSLLVLNILSGACVAVCFCWMQKSGSNLLLIQTGDRAALRDYPRQESPSTTLSIKEDSTSTPSTTKDEDLKR